MRQYVKDFASSYLKSILILIRQQPFGELGFSEALIYDIVFAN